MTAIGPFRRVLVGFDGSPDAAEAIRAASAVAARDGHVVSVKVVSQDEDPGRVLTGYAVEHGFDIVVLGRHGDGGRQKKLGRVFDAAVEACAVPVLLLSVR